MLARRSCQTWGVINRRERLDAARLYLVCDARSDEFLGAALRGGVDIVQLRVKHASDEQLLSAARRFARVCAEHDALLILNDRPDMVVPAGADGAHVGQDDVSTKRARALVGPERLVGLSTHTPLQVDAAGPEVDYIGVGPIHATPTKPGRPAVGLELVAYAARRARTPFFAIGGIAPGNARQVSAAGGKRIAVVRALTETADPELVARQLRAAVTREHDHSEAHLGAA
jgi:thiamine-phosphate pyrophosphorylase